METANPELRCHKNQPLPVLEIDGASEFTGFEKGSFGGPGVGKLSRCQWATPGYPENAKQFVCLDECLVKLSLVGGFDIFSIFIPIEGRKSPVDENTFFRWVGSTTN